MFESLTSLFTSILAPNVVMVSGSLGNELQGLFWFLVIVFLPLSIALVVISYLADMLPFLRRIIPWI